MAGLRTRPAAVSAPVPEGTAKSVEALPTAFARDASSVWLDCAHQGPLPRVAIEAAHRAVALKADPASLADLSVFVDTVESTRRTGARLLGADPDDVAVTNSASHGMNLLARGLALVAGDEVLLVAGAFPATNLPFLHLRERGVGVRAIEVPFGSALTVDRLAAALSPRSRVLALTWVDSFSGAVADLVAIGGFCRESGITLIVNGSQGVGARPIRVMDTPIDALVTCGYKWLCGPYGTGFTWIRPTLRRALRCAQSNWLVNIGDLGDAWDTGTISEAGVRAWDGYDTACFHNTWPWVAAIELLMEVGIESIRRSNDALVVQLQEGLRRGGYLLKSPHDAETRSAIVVFSHRERARNPAIRAKLAAAGVHVSLRRGFLRAAPHGYNESADIRRLLEGLAPLDAEA